MSIVEQFERAVREHPDGDAVRTAAATISYREFGERTQDLAKELDTCLGPGEFLGIEASREPGAITAMIAAMRAGRPFVFVDSRDSSRSNANKVGLLGVRLLARSGADGVVDLTDVPADWRPHREPAYRPPGLPSDGDICYAIHTSGSTGEPKCVLVRTAPLAAVIREHVTRLSVRPDSRTLQFARLTFDGCVTEILWTLTAGACLVVVDEARLAPGAELRETLERHGVTHLKTTPFALTSTEPAGSMRLAHVINGGGTCRPSVVARWSAVAAFHNAYGTTETTVCNLLSDPLDPGDCHEGVPLGDPVGDCDYHLRDVDDATGADGAVRRGEIVVTGDSVGVGYLTEHGVRPFGPDGIGGEYRTGDLAEYRDGRLYFVERLDRQVKVRGYRLDPGEIENAVCRLDPVLEAAVAVESHDGSQTAEDDALVCYYQGDIDPRIVRGHLEDVLDPYKIPSVLKRVGALPYTPNGKIDRDALRAIRQAPDATNDKASADQRLLDVVRGLTGVDDAAPEDNFFDLGGDSSSALVLVRKLRELGWVDAGVRDVLRAEDLRVLATQLREWGA